MLPLLQLFFIGLMFDAVLQILGLRAPGAVRVLLHYWKVLSIGGLLVLYATQVLRARGVKIAVPRGIVVAWALYVAIGYLGVPQGLVQGTTLQAQAIFGLHIAYEIPLLFAILVMPPGRPLPRLFETRLFHSLGLAALVVVGLGCTQAFRREAWENSPLIQRAMEERLVMFRTTSGVFRPFASFGSPFSFGYFCALLLVLSLAYLLFHRRARPVYWVIWITCCAGVIVSTIKGAILGALIGVTYLIAVRLRRGHSIAFRASMAVGLVLLGMAAPMAVALKHHIEAERRSQSIYTDTRSLDERWNWWQEAWDRIDSPWRLVFGLGTGGVGAAKEGRDRNLAHRWNPVDNFYLYQLVNHGFVGLLTWCALAFQLLWLFLHASQVEAEVDWFLHAAVALLVMNCGTALYSIGVFENPFEQGAFWILMGVAAVRAQELSARRLSFPAAGNHVVEDPDYLRQERCS